jgi:hypothetical protein
LALDGRGFPKVLEESRGAASGLGVAEGGLFAGVTAEEADQTRK